MDDFSQLTLSPISLWPTVKIKIEDYCPLRDGDAANEFLTIHSGSVEIAYQLRDTYCVQRVEIGGDDITSHSAYRHLATIIGAAVLRDYCDDIEELIARDIEQARDLGDEDRLEAAE